MESYSKDWRKLTTSYRPQISVQDDGINHNIDPEGLLMMIKVQRPEITPGIPVAQ